jgi:hypothetical protein
MAQLRLLIKEDRLIKGGLFSFSDTPAYKDIQIS